MHILIWLLLFFIFIPPESALAQQQGTLEYDYGDHLYKFYNGSQWFEVGTGVGVILCSQEAALDFVPALSIFRFCNGSVWVPVVGTLTLSGCGGSKGTIEYFNNSFHYCNGLLWINMKGPLSGGLLNIN